MTDIILHHYPMSPFAEKIRLVLGYKKINWTSVIIPMMMPKPDVVSLTGGHRRTPLLQIGADIYCDTALICDVLEHLYPAPTLYPEHQKGLARIVAQWADAIIFGPVMAYNFHPQGAAQAFGNSEPEFMKSFSQDRQTMRGGQPRMRPEDAASTYKSYLRRLSDILTDHPFLFGDAPCVADFSAYHPLWFTLEKTPAMASIFDATPLVRDWAKRMKDIGHGSFKTISSDDALKLSKSSQTLALNNEPFMDEHGIALGTPVVIRAESFGTEPTEGKLIASTRTRYSIERTDERAGQVHVHFPRIGFSISKVSP